MKQVANLDDIKQRALNAQELGKKWHFHILTPMCQLNVRDQYAFIFEIPADEVAFVYYSDQAEKTLGQELAPLLHGAKVLDNKTTDANYAPSDTIGRIIGRAKSLNESGIEWHHHLLFPGCRFNKNSPKHTLVFEDPEYSELLESITSEEPTNDLKQIEGLFYKV